MNNKPYRVLFVCLGNICRSPLAEGVFRHLALKAGLGKHLEIDSAGTAAWHEGKPPDSRMRQTAESRGVDISQQKARALRAEDLVNFDLILAMDRENLRNIQQLAAKNPSSARIELYRTFDPEVSRGESAEVPDPYYGGQEGFDLVFDMVERTSKVLLKELSSLSRAQQDNA